MKKTFILPVALLISTPSFAADRFDCSIKGGSGRVKLELTRGAYTFSESMNESAGYRPLFQVSAPTQTWERGVSAGLVIYSEKVPNGYTDAQGNILIEVNANGIATGSGSYYLSYRNHDAEPEVYALTGCTGRIGQ